MSLINAKEAILAAATRTAQAHGYAGLNFRELGAAVGIKSASIHYHFPTKADLGAAVARRYWEDTVVALDGIADSAGDPGASLRRYPEIFRQSLERDNRMCLCSFMAAEYDDLPDPVKVEVQTFTDVNVAWLEKMLRAANVVDANGAQPRARAIFAAVAGAQLVARSRADISLFDTLMAGYRDAGLLPG